MTLEQRTTRLAILFFLAALAFIAMACDSSVSEPHHACISETSDLPQSYVPGQRLNLAISTHAASIAFLNQWKAEHPNAQAFPRLFFICADRTEKWYASERDLGNFILLEEMAEFWLDCVQTEC